MRALILAAGLGSRLEHVTDNTPKALVPINNMPIMFYQIDALLSQGLTDLAVVVGYCGSKIIDSINKKYPDLNVSFFWNDKYAETNSAYSFWLASDWVKQNDYIHLNCDIIFSKNLLRQIINHGSNNIIATRSDLDIKSRAECVRISNGVIKKMTYKYEEGDSAKAFGLARFGGEALISLHSLVKEEISAGGVNEHLYALVRKNINNYNYYAQNTSAQDLLEVNTLEDLKVAQEKVLTWK